METLANLHNYDININTREIYLNDLSLGGDDFGGGGVDHRSSALFIKNIRYLDSLSNETITVYINTIGGDWYSGMAIYDTIKSVSSPVSMHVYGQCSSIGSVILQSANERCVSVNSVMLCHFGQMCFIGDFTDAKSRFNIEKDLVNKMVNIYAEVMINSCVHGNKDIGGVKQYILDNIGSRDVYFIGQQIVDNGLADKVLHV